MPLAHLISGRDIPQKLGAESKAANEFMLSYLNNNAEASEIVANARGLIESFRSLAPVFFASKCIDGRVHGSDAKGYPPTTVTFSRTEGNNVAMTPENAYFWNRVNGVALDAERHTPGTPAIFLALGHHSTLGSGCAAHKGDDVAALDAVAKQASAIREKYGDYFYVLHGMTNTDDGAERIIFPDQHEIDTTVIIRLLNTESKPLSQPAHVLQTDFLDRLIDDPITDRFVGGKKPRDIMHGADAPMFNDLQTMIAMETYLLHEVTLIVRNDARNNIVFDERLFDHVRTTIEAVSNLPEALKAPLMYQTLWNVAYALHRRERMAALKGERRVSEIQHAEQLVGYGDGFEIERRNFMVLAKPGRGDDRIALDVAKQVLEGNRKKSPQKHPPIVHVNAEIAGDILSWEALKREVLAPLKTRTDNVHAVFGSDCRVLLTYSKSKEKCFYPIRLVSDQPHAVKIQDERESLPFDVTRSITDQALERDELKRRENAYRQMMLGD